MGRYVAFLRGMNLGRRRITNDELCDCFRSLGFADVSAFLASGNVIFDAPRVAAAKLAARIEEGLSSALGYEVPTFIRTAVEVTAIVEQTPFADSVVNAGGKIQVAMFTSKPGDTQRKRVLALGTKEDHLSIIGRELYWLPKRGILDSAIDLTLIEATLGPMTMRTQRTLGRINDRFLH